MKRLTANAGLLAKIGGHRTNAKKPRKKEIALNQKLLLIVVTCMTLSRGGNKLSLGLKRKYYSRKMSLINVNITLKKTCF
jgi:hypothetical protein